MNRHLLPDEFDQLLDGEVGFGVPPLQAHVRECGQCRSELESARVVVEQIERLPHLRPSPAFAEKVMAQVNVFEPWHVAAANTIRALVPRQRPLRIALGAAALTGCFTLTTVALWVVAQFDLALLLAGSLYETAVSAAGSALAAAVGPQLAATLSSGDPNVALTLAGVMAVAAALSVLALRRASRVAVSRSRP